MKKVLIVPHQDDELFVSKFLPEFEQIVIAFRGGGESKAEPNLTEQELFDKRCKESLEVCKLYNVAIPKFMELKRPINETLLRDALKVMCPLYDIIVTTHFNDAHHEHQLLGKCIKDIAETSYGYFVNTKSLIEQLDKEMPDKYIKLTEEEYKIKLERSRLYKTQNHFLPNVVGRPEYKKEYLWKM
jgi:hypothetical protein